MRERTRARRLAGGIASAAALALGFSAAAQNSKPPAGLEVEPNAIQDPGSFMSIEVSGVPEGEKAWLEVLRDCDGDQEPDRQGTESCVSPFYSRWSRPAKRNTKVRDRFIFQALAAEGHPFPDETTLWLRAARGKEGPGLTVRFGLVSDPCSLWRSVVDAFLGGRCDPGLAQALRQHRGGSDLVDTVFEVGLVTVDEEAQVRTISATRGATGVAWLDRTTLLVTIAPTAREAGGPEEPPGLEPGVYRIPLGQGEPELLWVPAPGDEWMPAAPLTLPGGRVAFVRQRLNEQVLLTGEPVAYLHTLRGGRLDAGAPLTYKVHQLLGADSEGDSVLALTLGVAASKPALLTVDLTRREMRYLGYHHSLYQAALRSPTGGESVIAMEDNSDRYGWDLVMVDAKGRWTRDLVKRPALHELLPSWRPEGREIAFLSQVRARP